MESRTGLDALIARAEGLAAAGERRILGIAGTPGSGKSTLAAAVTRALEGRAVLVGMDGFHLANEELVRLRRRNRKGAPDTFDVRGYVALLGALRQQHDGVVYAPRFDRSLEASIGSAVPVDAHVPLVITEGNYLLLLRDGWARVRGMLDESWYVDVAADVRRRRLVERRIEGGYRGPDIDDWVRVVDEPNAWMIERESAPADVRIDSAAITFRPS